MEFRSALEALLAQVPAGRVTTFGALADALGDPQAAPAVSRILAAERPRGWHRVVRSDGTLPFPEAASALESEGVEVTGGGVTRLEDRLEAALASDRPLARLREEQAALARRIVLEDRFGTLDTVAGFDVAYRGRRAFAPAVVLDWETLETVEEVALPVEVPFPYVPTYLGAREGDPIARCHEALRRKPSLLLVDGNGILHPAAFGVACHVGVRLDRPTVGVAKSLLLGTVEGSLERPGDAAPILHGGRTLGYAYRPAAPGKPVYVSPGHRLSPETALRLVRRLCRHRLPEPLRLADRAARRLRAADDRSRGSS